MKNLSFANRWNVDLIDQQYDVWLNNPEALGSDWRAFFEGFELAKGYVPTTEEAVVTEASIIDVINTYRYLGHTQAAVNPLDTRPTPNPALSLKELCLSEADLNKNFYTGNYLGGKVLKVCKILDNLNRTYCGSVGYENAYIHDTVKRRWLETQIESTFGQPQFSNEKKIRILRKISSAEIFERFLHTRYVGQKRFSLEGAETLIPALDGVLETAPSVGIEEVVIGMAHRGRLNVLANIVGKSYDFIFKEFSENYIPESMYGDADVKYHLGFETIYAAESGKKVALSLAPNPSHLEAVDPVVEGKTRARQRIRNDTKRKKVLPLLIHGDAAIAGQGMVAETLNLAKLVGYCTGGTFHIVVNNQIGFTTRPEQGRSGRYCTDVAKMIEAPIFHVNGDDPLAVVMVVELALKYRQKFSEDVVIDMYCYRKHGHNESDEPAFTQPVLYKEIARHRPISRIFTERLIHEGTLTQEEAESIKQEFQSSLKDAFDRHKKEKKVVEKKSTSHAASIQPPYNFKYVTTAVDEPLLKKVAKALLRTPATFKVNPKIERQLENRKKVIESGQGFDWGFGESLAFGTLLLEGTPVRLSGQDCERGTFSHRHAVFYDIENQRRYIPLLNLGKKQALFCIHNSSLSEAAILGFDYGYSLDYPQMLSVWEAQFGDFVNGAQVIIDQFIISSESKWQCISGIVLLLPHGYEGQGSEHSSARPERFLQSCAEENIQVCNPTTPAQMFHLLRRQMKRRFRKPLIVMTPKSLLRHKLCVSQLRDFTSGHFETIRDDPQPAKKGERLIFCSGKVYYDLINCRDEHKVKNASVVRIEQLYPFDHHRLDMILKKHDGWKRVIWCQEEPQNMGAWNFIAPILQKALGPRVTMEYAGRRASASPAVGVLAIHKVEQKSLVESAFLK